MKKFLSFYLDGTILVVLSFLAVLGEVLVGKLTTHLTIAFPLICLFGFLSCAAVFIWDMIEWNGKLSRTGPRAITIAISALMGLCFLFSMIMTFVVNASQTTTGATYVEIRYALPGMFYNYTGAIETEGVIPELVRGDMAYFSPDLIFWVLLTIIYTAMVVMTRNDNPEHKN